jgi:CubicO group peptidase (beta-lactamase class C family)
MAALLLVAATVLLWPRDRPAALPTSVPAPRATRPPTDPAALQKQLDGVVEAGASGVVGLVHTGHRIGSVTKSFVATVVLQLVGEGRLGLDDTLERWLPELVPGGERIAGPHARGYAPPDQAWRATDGRARLVDVTELDPSWAWAAGAMVSTTADLARFYQALLGGQLLTPELLEAMQTTVDARDQMGPGWSYGLGLEARRLGCHRVWGHGGSLPGYNTAAFSTPAPTASWS